MRYIYLFLKEKIFYFSELTPQTRILFTFGCFGCYCFSYLIDILCRYNRLLLHKNRNSEEKRKNFLRRGGGGDKKWKKKKKKGYKVRNHCKGEKDQHTDKEKNKQRNGEAYTHTRWWSISLFRSLKRSLSLHVLSLKLFSWTLPISRSFVWAFSLSSSLFISTTLLLIHAKNFLTSEFHHRFFWFCFLFLLFCFLFFVFVVCVFMGVDTWSKNWEIA